MDHGIDYSQGSNLTFEDNSQMASTWSRFTSHKCVSTSLGTCAVQNSHFHLTNNSNMRKCKTAVAINCTNFRFDEDRVVLLPESSLPLLRVGVLVVYQIENYFPNIEFFYFLQFMPVVEMVRMFEDLLISYLYRRKLSSQDGYQMRKIH